MPPLVFRTAATTELGLKLAEMPGWFHGALPLGGNDATQIALVLGGAYLLHEAGGIATDARKRIRDWWRKRGA
jgi:hypothetical protein